MKWFLLLICSTGFIFTTFLLSSCTPPPENKPIMGNSSGSAYIFRKVGGTWIQELKLKPTDGDLLIFRKSAKSVGVFRRSGSSWIEEAILDTKADSVAISGSHIAVVEQDSGNSGSLSLFSNFNGAWTEDDLQSGRGSYGNYGNSIAIDGNTVVVSGTFDDGQSPLINQCYIYRKIGGKWVLATKLRPLDTSTYIWFGSSLSIDEGTIIMGASFDKTNGEKSGAAYVAR
jgi:hypothetical protein